MRKLLTVIPLAVLVSTACAVTPDDDAATSSDSESLSCSIPSTAASSSSNHWWKSQYDGTSCQDENCGPTAVAMMRYALTCGESNHTGGWMRNEMNTHTASASCNPTNASEWADLLNTTDGHGNWVDGTKKFTATEHCGDGYDINDLAADMAKGAVAVMSGSAGAGQKAPCGFTDGHALFIGHWNGSTFSVYDPDSHNDPGSGTGANCGSTRTGHATIEWNKTQLATWSEGASTYHNHICAVVANGWNGGACVPGATRACSSPDCCGTCGHAMQTCSSSQTWVTGVCQNGC
jgi:hypothetical protein